MIRGLARARRAISAVAAIALMGVAPSAALAHGAVSMDQDVCKLTVGPHQMHFAGYQPKFTRSEFCEDIPQVGKTIVVLDFVDDRLRDLKSSVKIVRPAPNGQGPEMAVYELPPKTYPNGSIAIDYTFEGPGQFVGIVTVGEGDSMHVGRFPFTVGKDQTWLHLLIGGAATVLVGASLFYWAERRRRVAGLAAVTEAAA